MKIIALIIVLLNFSTAFADSNTLARKDSKQPQTVEFQKQISFKGWDYLVGKLLADGVEESQIKELYLDPRMPSVGTVYFQLKPRETKSMYAGFKNKTLLKRATDFITANRRTFESAERIYKVNRFVIASIMLVESHFGSNTGNHLILNRLSRVGSIARPENVAANYKQHIRTNPKVKYSEVEDRARYLEDSFYPEVLALIKISKKHNKDLLELRGSTAGAFGIPQFLPSTFLNYAVDGRGNGVISLYDEVDAIFSTANYLMHSGWKDNASREEKEAVIWKYNRSQPYVETILSIADELKKN